ncbi:uncharacterized protein LOC127094054 [Lathyrus oleraceus]|uniref:uncharacterized protein LOC127094054 n=1 Tax=Pisum sativum TaxID=3888 RepID=UPI0021CEC731|nr:uncharacterized protein LOC127094054 [Pisum sativum]
MQFQEETRTNQKNTTASLKNLEVQMRQIAQQLASNSQAPSTLPIGTVTNPWEYNNVNTVVTRSGKSTEENSMEEDGLLEVDLEIKETKDQDEEVLLPLVEEKEKLEINIPLTEALEQIPIYAKFMKDIISKKRSIDIDSTILTETYSAILQGMKIPVKKEDRGSVTIPCTISDRKFKKALINLGASVSLMPLSIYKKLGIGTIQDTRMTLQFVNRSVRRPYGIVEDVLVKIDKFVFPVDFVILEMPGDEEIPLILGRPFLETGRYDIGISHTVEIIDQVIAQEIEKQMPQSSLEHVLSLSIFESDEDEGDFEVLAMMGKQFEWVRSKPHRREDLIPPPLSDITKEPKIGVNLKQLPANLKYVFLDTEKKCPAIINASLQSVQEVELIQVLKKYKDAIGWAIEDLKGYNQIAVTPEDQEKTTFTCPYGVFAYRRMSFGLCNIPATFQRNMPENKFDPELEKVSFHGT